jgi:L-methionine (R)-S-oxide reductase
MEMNEQKVLEQIHEALASTDSRQQKVERIAEAIRKAGPYRWVGIYEVDSKDITIVGWSGQGEPAYPHFPASKGLCGSAVASRKTVLVGDVTKDPRYLTTFGSTRSEIVIPVVRLETGSVVALIDAESERMNAFTSEDQILLEKCAAAISEIGKK